VAERDGSGTTVPSHELYDATAERWIRREPTSLSDFTGRPRTLALCEPVAGRRVLDLGCGEGYCARRLVQMGAAEVLGVDSSGQMITAARAEEARAPLGIRYEVGDATELAELADASFDLVLAMFLFNYLEVEATRRCMAEVWRVLRPGGRFVFAVPHPALPFVRDEEPPFYFSVPEGGYFSSRDRRFPGKIWKRDGTALEVQLVHKTFEDYFAALGAAGFRALPTLLELGTTPEIEAIDPAFFGPLADVPLHAAFAIDR
jgi:ubiquinone/menaquinone biosynthesis C-methylase UbiE